MKILAALFALLFANAAWADCPLDLGKGTGWVVFSDHYMIAFRPEPMRIEVGQPFSLLFNVCTKSNSPAELLMVDATMPEHKHPMNYRPTIVAGTNGRYRADGLVFHMPGRWELSIDVRAGEESERLTHDFILK
ncbi:MAG: FixH family protein [Rhodospirillales bacterium]|nr:FixH family protein [Rhodospirillales bacterium]